MIKHTALALTLAATSANAIEIVNVETHMQCANSADIQRMVKDDFEEQGFAQGSGVVSTPTEPVRGNIKIYLNSTTETFSVVIEDDTVDVSCMIVSGDDFAPYIDPTDTY